MSTVAYTLRIDENDKQTAEQVFSQLGLTLSAGLNVYLKAVVRQKKIPFELSLNEKQTAAEQIAAQKFLEAMNDIRKTGFTPEDDEAINALQRGDYKINFDRSL